MGDQAQYSKKKKRQSDSDFPAKKRAAVQPDPQITIISRESSQLTPIIASTPGFEIDPSVKFTAYCKSRQNKHKERPCILTQELLLYSSDHPKLDYIAREEDLGGSDALTKHYVGIYNPNTNNLEVIEARNMVVRGTIRSHEYRAQDQVVSNTLKEQRNILGQTFGTKKARRAIASIAENAISPSLSLKNSDEPLQLNSAATKMLSNVAEATKDMKNKEDLAKVADEVKPRPKANTQTTKIEDVYTAESLIGIDILKLLPFKEWQDKAKANEEIFVKSKFVANRIQSNANNMQKLKILRFMLLLLDLYRKFSKSRERRRLPRKEDFKEMLGDLPEAILQSVTQKFTDKGVVDKYHSDLIITHLCAMSLLIDDFHTDTCDLKEDLYLDLAQITKYYSEIGVKSHVLGASDVLRYGKIVASQRRVAKLKLPLTFPKLPYSRRRK